jgi:hypothetical protein
MNLHYILKFWCTIGIGIVLLCGCAALSPAPKVDIGYLETESGSSIPAAFVDYAPGMTFSAQYSPKVEDTTARHSYYTETISYANGKKTEIEFFVTRVNPYEFEVSINGRVKKVPTYQEFTENIAPTLKDKISFALLPGGFGAPLMKVPQMCPSAVELTKQYSPIASNQFLNSLDRIILKCTETGKAHYLTFSYVRENNIDSLIQSFKVKIEETALSDPPPAKEEAASGPTVPGVNSKLPTPTPVVVSAITDTPTNTPAPTPTTETVVEPSGVYLAKYKPTTYSLGYGTYSVGTFAFSSEDPADNIHKGNPIILNGVEYPHAIFAHAPSRMVFDLGQAAGFAEITATVGLVKQIECGDGVIFVVIGDGAEIFRSNTIFAWTPPTEIQVPIQGVRMLTLFTDEGPQDDNSCDWAIWGDPILR